MVPASSFVSQCDLLFFESSVCLELQIHCMVSIFVTTVQGLISAVASSCSPWSIYFVMVIYSDFIKFYFSVILCEKKSVPPHWNCFWKEEECNKDIQSIIWKSSFEGTSLHKNFSCLKCFDADWCLQDLTFKLHM